MALKEMVLAVVEVDLVVVLEEVAQSGSIEAVIDPPSPIIRHVKWKMARTKKTRKMTSEAAKEIIEKITSHLPHMGCKLCV